MTHDVQSLLVTLADIHEARDRIERHALRTPLVHSESISRDLGCDVHFKCENLQRVGAFKARGACNAVLSLDHDAAARGVVTHSSGNHAAALARAAKIRGIPAHIVMPRNTPKHKIARVESFGITPLFSEPDAASRASVANELQKRTGATLIHPYNNLKIIAGQGTVGVEILEQLDQTDSIVVPVGGGGLLSGVLVAVKSCRPEIKIIAAEPAWADDTARSLQSGKIEMPTRYDTIADGLRTPLGELTFEIIRSLLDDVLLVDEAPIKQATRTIARRVRMIAEPSGAVPLAAVIQHREHFRGQNVVAVVSGGNLDIQNFDLRGDPSTPSD